MIGIKDQYFGTEIEMTGITRQRAAEVVAEMFGTEAYYDGTTYGVWSVIDLEGKKWKFMSCLLYTSPSPRDPKTSRMPSSA